MRIFYALTFDDKSKEIIYRIQQQLLPAIKTGKMTIMDNFHLTLFFVGNIDAKDIHNHIDILKKIKKLPQNISIVDINSFIKKNKHILFCDVEPSYKLLECETDLAELLKTTMNIDSNFSVYHPHITLGRNIVLSVDKNTLSTPVVDLPIHSIALMESKQIDGVLKYIPLYEIKTKNKNP